MVLIILLGFSLLIICILLLKITINVEFNFNGKDSAFQLRIIMLFGLINKRINIGKSLEKSTDEEMQSSITSQFKLDEFINKLKIMHTKIKNELNCIQMNSLTWNTSVGTGEADITGILSGTLLGLKGMFIGILSMYFTVSDELEMNVAPVYQGKGIYTEVKIYLSFRLIRIMIAFISIYFLWRKIQTENNQMEFQFE